MCLFPCMTQLLETVALYLKEIEMSVNMREKTVKTVSLIIRQYVIQENLLLLTAKAYMKSSDLSMTSIITIQCQNLMTPLERRVIVAYYLSKLRDKPKLGRKGVDIMQYVPNDSNYNEALKLLVPENDLISTLRDKGFSKLDCLYSSTIRYDLCLKYLISMEDMQNRLRLR